MNQRYLCLFAIGLWLLTILGLAIRFTGGSTEPHVDGRTVIHLSEPERDYVLAEMRQLLASVQGMVAGLAEGDMGRVQEAARVSGAAAPRNAPPELMLNLPLAFKKTGMSVHKGFDEIAEAVEQGATPAQVLQRLGGQLGTCVGCHATYRLN